MLRWAHRTAPGRPRAPRRLELGRLSIRSDETQSSRQMAPLRESMCPCVTFRNGLLIVMRAAPKGGIRESSVRSCSRFRPPQTSCTHRRAYQISSGGTSLKQRWLAWGDFVPAINMSARTAMKRAILRCEELTMGNNI